MHRVSTLPPRAGDSGCRAAACFTSGTPLGIVLDSRGQQPRELARNGETVSAGKKLQEVEDLQNFDIINSDLALGSLQLEL